MLKIEKKNKKIWFAYFFFGLNTIDGFALIEYEKPADSRISPYLDINSSKVPESKARA